MKNKVVVLTGATSGIGKELLKQLVKEEAIVIVGVRDIGAVSPNKEVTILPLDLLNEESIQAFAKKIPLAIDLLIHCAGIASFEEAKTLPIEATKQMFQVNTFSVIELTQALLPKLRKQGEILFVASIAGELPTAKSSSYAASKAALITYAEALRMEVVDRKIRVINTGPVATAFHGKADKDGRYREKVKKFFLQPELVAREILQLVETRKWTLNLPRYYSVFLVLKTLFPKFFQKITKKFVSWK